MSLFGKFSLAIFWGLVRAACADELTLEMNPVVSGVPLCIVNELVCTQADSQCCWTYYSLADCAQPKHTSVGDLGRIMAAYLRSLRLPTQSELAVFPLLPRSKDPKSLKSVVNRIQSELIYSIIRANESSPVVNTLTRAELRQRGNSELLTEISRGYSTPAVDLVADIRQLRPPVSVVAVGELVTVAREIAEVRLRLVFVNGRAADLGLWFVELHSANPRPTKEARK